MRDKIAPSNEQAIGPQQVGVSRRSILLGGTALAAAAATLTSPPAVRPAKAQAAGGKPNILFIMGDDIGWFNVSAYNMGIMGYRTPNIDRIGKEGAVFTDWYGQQSCTAGRAAFITGQSPIRTGLTKVGLPGAELGLGPLDPCVADVHEVARLRHRPVRQEPSGRPQRAPADGARLRRVLRQPLSPQRRGRAGESRLSEGPALPREVRPARRAEVQGERPRRSDRRSGVRQGRQADRSRTPARSTPSAWRRSTRNFSPRRRTSSSARTAAGAPWFCYFNSTRMHVFTHLKKESQGKTGLGIYPDGMVETDGHVGELLKLLDDLGAADNTIVVYTTDNGAEAYTWPDGGSTPFKGEKATNWEGGFRVPCLIRWPGVIKPGTIVNDICAHEDFIPTFAAAAGEPDLVDKLLKGTTLNGKTFKVHLDGDNLMPFLKGEVKKSPREDFLYWSDDGDLMAIRVANWKVAFMEQNTETSRRRHWASGKVSSRSCACPSFTTCASDPFEKGTESIDYADWSAHRTFTACAGAGHRREMAGELQGVSAARQGGELHRQRRDGQDHGCIVEPELTARPPGDANHGHGGFAPATVWRVIEI